MTAASGVAVGVGNPTMGDDGLGQAVVQMLEAEVHGFAVDFVGTTALLALEAMDGTDRAVVVDAIDAAGPPGTVYRMGLNDDTVPTEVLMHDFTFAEAVQSCGAAYDLPDRIVVVGVVPAAIEPRTELSETVSRAVPAAAAAVTAELDGSRHNGGDRFVDATWYCVDCETRIDADAVDEHERKEHSVRARLQPERLLSQDPWQTGQAQDENNSGDSGGGT